MVNTFQLDVKEDKSIITFSGNTITLPIGTKNIDGFMFQNSPITAYEAEMAIEHIENVIMPARTQLPSGELAVNCSDDRILQLLQALNITGQFISTEQIEILFNELASVINGSPSHSIRIPTDKSFSAFLLIVREITHHWQLDGVNLNNISIIE